MLMSACVFLFFCDPIKRSNIAMPVPESHAVTWQEALDELDRSFFYEEFRNITSPQNFRFASFDTFYRHVDADSLADLTHHPKAIIRLYALLAGLHRNLPHHDQALVRALSDTSKVWVATNRRTHKYVLNQMVFLWLSTRLTWARVGKIGPDDSLWLTPETIRQFYAYVLHENLDDFWEQLMTKHPVPHYLEEMLREAAENGNANALWGLAGFQNPQDLLLLSETLSTCGAGKEAWRAAGVFPHPELQLELEEDLERVPFSREPAKHFAPLFEAILQQDSLWAEMVLQTYFEAGDPAKARYTKQLSVFFTTLTQRPGQMARHRRLLETLVLQHAVMDLEAFQFLAKDVSFGLELCERLLDDPQPIFLDETTPQKMVLWLLDQGEAGRAVHTQVAPEGSLSFEPHPHLKAP